MLREYVQQKKTTTYGKPKPAYPNLLVNEESPSKKLWKQKSYNALHHKNLIVVKSLVSLVNPLFLTTTLSQSENFLQLYTVKTTFLTASFDHSQTRQLYCTNASNIIVRWWSALAMESRQRELPRNSENFVAFLLQLSIPN